MIELLNSSSGLSNSHEYDPDFGWASHRHFGGTCGAAGQVAALGRT
jgi:hypothetical protein